MIVARLLEVRTVWPDQQVQLLETRIRQLCVASKDIFCPSRICLRLRLQSRSVARRSITDGYLPASVSSSQFGRGCCLVLLCRSACSYQQTAQGVNCDCYPPGGKLCMTDSGRRRGAPELGLGRKRRHVNLPHDRIRGSAPEAARLHRRPRAPAHHDAQGDPSQVVPTTGSFALQRAAGECVHEVHLAREQRETPGILPLFPRANSV